MYKIFVDPRMLSTVQKNSILKSSIYSQTNLPKDAKIHRKSLQMLKEISPL